MGRIINLLPPQEQKEIKFELIAMQLRKFWIAVILSLVIFACLSLAAFLFLQKSSISIESEILEKKQELSSSDTKLLEEQVIVLNDHIGEIANLQNQHFYWSLALSELALILPADMSVDFLELDRETGKVDLSGTAHNRTSILKFWADMHNAVYFNNINFPLSNLERAQEASFSFSFYLDKQQITKQ